MDYTLETLTQAFSTEYQKANKKYKLFALLLCTTLDKEFLAEYLSYFHELHHLTGKDVLVIGPKLVQPDSFENLPKDALMSSSLQYLKNDSYPEEKLEIQKRFLNFLNIQTSESYQIARHLGINTSKLPLLVFFEKIDMSDRYVIWPLNDLTGSRFVKKFREIIEHIRIKCHWDIDYEIFRLESTCNKLERIPYSYWNLNSCPYDYKKENEDYIKVGSELQKIKTIVEFYKNLESLFENFNNLQMSEVKVPTENISKSILKIKEGIITEDSFAHLHNWKRRWKSRLSHDIKLIIDKLHFPYDNVKSSELQISKVDAELKFKELQERFAINKEKLFSKKENQLNLIRNELEEKKQIRANSNSIDALEIISSTIKEQASSTRNLDLSHSIYTASHHNFEPPKVFISYSHDNKEHKEKVLNLAQSLRANGINCWIDQFDNNPEYGFSRWMYEQIAISDFVLVVCTQKYCNRFEAINTKRSSGVNFEGHLILQELNEKGLKNSKYIPIILDDSDGDYVPLILNAYRRYQIPKEFEDLNKYLLGQNNIKPIPLGRMGNNES
ncbi:MAG: SEFIR domain-containing protein [Bacteroidales bacterium]